MEPIGELMLKIVEEYTKTGLGAGTRTTILEEEPVGTIDNPELGKIRSILVQHAHERSRAGYPFNKLWTDPKDKQRKPLKVIIGNNASIGEEKEEVNAKITDVKSNRWGQKHISLNGKKYLLDKFKGKFKATIDTPEGKRVPRVTVKGK